MNEMSERNNIVLSHPDELMEFLWVKPKISGINVDIFVDDSKSYQRNNRPLLLMKKKLMQKEKKWVSVMMNFKKTQQEIH